MTYHNRKRKPIKDYVPGQLLYVRTDKWLDIKLSNQFKQEIVKENRNTTIVTESGRIIHKSHIRNWNGLKNYFEREEFSFFSFVSFKYFYWCRISLVISRSCEEKPIVPPKYRSTGFPLDRIDAKFSKGSLYKKIYVPSKVSLCLLWIFHLTVWL